MPGLSARPSTGQRIRVLLAEQRQIGALCDLLEKIADDLPRACPSRHRRAAEELATLVPDYHALTFDVLSDLLTGDQRDLLLRIVQQHGEDEGLASELAQAIEPLCRGDLPAAPETLGFMLRCFFASYRRSMLVGELAIRVSGNGPVAPDGYAGSEIASS